jgi:hypothetical protein
VDESASSGKNVDTAPAAIIIHLGRALGPNIRHNHPTDDDSRILVDFTRR